MSERSRRLSRKLWMARAGLALSFVERVRDPEFNDTNLWVKGAGWVVDGGVATATTAGNATTVAVLVEHRINVAKNDKFRWEIIVDSVTQGGFALTNTALWGIGPTLSAPGTYTGIVTASAGGVGALSVRAVGTTSGVVSRFSFKQII